MDDWDVEHTVLRRRQQDLLREVEDRKWRIDVSSVPCMEAGRLAAGTGGAGRSRASQPSSLPSSVRYERVVVNPETTLPNRCSGGGAVILRVWRTKIDPARLEAYRRFERERCLPMLHKQPGLLGVLFLREAEDQAASITIWEDRGTVEALESSPSYRKTVRELAVSGLLVREQSVEIFEVAGGALRLEALAGALGSGDD